MNIRTIELREIRLRLVHFFETSFGRTTERRIMLVRVIDSDGAEGWGECTAGEGPFYSEEWIDSAWEVTRLFLAPMVLGQEVEGAADVFGLMRRVRGNRMAKAAIETACWDLESKRAGVPLWRHLGGVQPEILCGVSIGIQDSHAQLLEKLFGRVLNADGDAARNLGPDAAEVTPERDAQALRLQVPAGRLDRRLCHAVAPRPPHK